MSKKTLLLIAGVAIMFAAATSASAYYERWDGWFNSGYLDHFIYGRFDYSSGEGPLEDMTDGDVDDFFVGAVTPSTFTSATTGYYIMLWPGASGWKDTGEEGQKEAYDGEWTGIARLYDDEGGFIRKYDVEGTWNTGTSDDGYYFDYDPETPTYSAEWDASNSVPGGITGGHGGSEGERVYYED